jgi:two-component system, NarL family, nitrate/nitrite response regulator NarL
MDLIRLLLVDDHPMVREGLRARLASAPGFAVVAEAADAGEALEALAQQRIDLAVMDVALRGASGIALTRELLARQPSLRVLVLSMYDNPGYVAEAQRAGARGYVLKDSPAESIVAALRALAVGEVVWPSNAAADEGPHLTPREREVLGLLAEGLTSAQIGERLGMGARTVETHRLHLRRKLQLDSPTALLRFAMEGGWR